jgi:hypothetical protein
MDNSVLVTIITTSGSIIAASTAYFLTKRMQTRTEWQHEKMNHYKVLLSAISDLANDGADQIAASDKFALASNTICLVAPQSVIDALMNFHDEVKASNENKTLEKHDFLLKQLLFAIRKDIGLSAKDDTKNFNYHLIGASPLKKKRIYHDRRD